MVNTKCDTSYYDSRGYQRKIFDGNVLYESKAKAMKGSDWKPQVQRFNMTYLLELSKMQRDLENMEYEFLPTTNFTLHERGKLRRITGEQVQDRIVKHALCDEVLNPLIEPHLIYDNGASVVGKGIAFTRKRLLTHLRKYYAHGHPIQSIKGGNEMYTITLANGTKLTGLDMNGTNYVSKEKVDETIFKDNLSTMKVSDGETETTYTDMVFIQQMEWADGTFYLAFREKTKEEKLVAALNATSNSITDVQVALAEVYEMVLGGN